MFAMNIRTNLQVGLNTFVVGALRINGSVQGKMVVSCDAMEYHEMGYIYCVYIVYNSVYIYIYMCVCVCGKGGLLSPDCSAHVKTCFSQMAKRNGTCRSWRTCCPCFYHSIAVGWSQR